MADTSEITASIDALTQEYYTITQNLANVSTTGYKRRLSEFVQVLSQVQGAGGVADAPEITAVGAIDFSQAGLEQTGRGLDAAISGRGFFVVETPDGPLYTRNGVFHTNQQGQLVDSCGRLVAGESGPIVIPRQVPVSSVRIAADGGISAGGSDVGRLRLVDFGEDQGLLVSVGDGCFRVPEDVRPGAAEGIVVKQGYRESSNVNIVEELVKLITVTRMYESNMKLLKRQQENTSSLLSVAAG